MGHACSSSGAGVLGSATETLASTHVNAECPNRREGHKRRDLVGKSAGGPTTCCSFTLGGTPMTTIRDAGTVAARRPRR